MKYFLLLSFLWLASTSIYAQSSFREQLAYKSDIEVERFQIYPNPAVDYIQLEGSTNVKELVIFNLVGRQVKTFPAVEGQKYFIGDIPKGLYLIQLRDAQKRTLTTLRVNKR
ncbi:MAG TPA: T9SS type A sorting domain-containing protein [Saprospiraceae bacterium]|nr:T9SS type A sorting domain-containing protein [Saprospiraceae bacterium]HMQ85272.1 T9SS type A sorting domain-containing protein [Saprospiraceae bacterium]